MLVLAWFLWIDTLPNVNHSAERYGTYFSWNQRTQYKTPEWIGECRIEGGGSVLGVKRLEYERQK